MRERIYSFFVFLKDIQSYAFGAPPPNAGQEA
jgi:hypothetical protein